MEIKFNTPDYSWTIHYNKIANSYFDFVKKTIRAKLIPFLEGNKNLITTNKGLFTSILTSTVCGIQSSINSERQAYIAKFDELYDTIAKKINDVMYAEMSNIILKNDGQVVSDFILVSKIENKNRIDNITTKLIKDIETTIISAITNSTTYDSTTYTKDDISIANEIISGILLAIFASQQSDTKSLFAKLNNTIKQTSVFAISNFTQMLKDVKMAYQGLFLAKWKTKLDGRERACHRDRHDKIFDIRKGLYSSCDGRTIKTGQEYNCRCKKIYFYNKKEK